MSSPSATPASAAVGGDGAPHAHGYLADERARLVAEGVAESEDDLESTIVRVSGTHVVVFWLVGGVVLCAVAYVWHSSKHKFRHRVMTDALAHSADLVYAFGHLAQQANLRMPLASDGAPPATAVPHTDPL
jgi:hypothetical protein